MNSPRQSISPLKLVLFSILAIGFFLGSLELVIHLAGIHPVEITEDPYVGFGKGHPLFVKAHKKEGKWILTTSTRKRNFFNPQSFPLEKNPGTFRVFTLGGSTTYGRPYQDSTSFSRWLRVYLPMASKVKNIEVINAGGISYASYRITRLLQELKNYDPDLFIVYTGHNEFLESRTYGSLKKLPPLLFWLDGYLSRTHIYTLIKTKFFKEKKQKKDLLPAEVNTALENSIGPSAYSRNDPYSSQVVDHFKSALSRMADLAHKEKIHLLFITPPSNLRDCRPFKDELNKNLSPRDSSRVRHWVQNLSLALDSNQYGSLRALIDSLSTIPHRSAKAWHLIGEGWLELKMPKSAEKAFQKSRDEDVCPLRAVSPIIDGVEDVAREKQVPYIPWHSEIKKWGWELYGDSLLGDQLFLDHVHLQVRSHAYLAELITKKILELEWLPKSTDDGPVPYQQIYDGVMKNFREADHGTAIHNIAKVYNWAGKFKDAASMGKKALALDSESIEAVGSSLIVGADFHRQGHLDSALGHYMRALRLDPNNEEANRFVARIYEEKKEWEKAEPYVQKALAFKPGDTYYIHLLGKVFLNTNRPSRAIEPLAYLVRAFPKNGQFALELGMAYTKAGQTFQGASFLRQARNLGVTSPEAHSLLREAERLKKSNPLNKNPELDPKKKEALEGLKRALETR